MFKLLIYFCVAQLQKEFVRRGLEHDDLEVRNNIPAHVFVHEQEKNHKLFNNEYDHV